VTKRIYNKNVYVDLDGVLADLNYELSKYVNFVYNVKLDLTSRSQFFKYLPEYAKNEGFFRQRKLKNADILMDRLSKLECNIIILSSCGSILDNPSVIANQKRKWFENNFENIMNIPFITTTSGKDKSIFANDQSFLIDDHIKNIDNFIDQGGKGFIYTHDMIDECIDEVRQFLKG
jgi:5'(3')-deoxyribonucleotidase